MRRWLLRSILRVARNRSKAMDYGWRSLPLPGRIVRVRWSEVSMPTPFALSLEDDISAVFYLLPDPYDPRVPIRYEAERLERRGNALRVPEDYGRVTLAMPTGGVMVCISVSRDRSWILDHVLRAAELLRVAYPDREWIRDESLPTLDVLIDADAPN